VGTAPNGLRAAARIAFAVLRTEGSGAFTICDRDHAIATVKGPQATEDAAASRDATPLGLDGFDVLGRAEAGGELKLLIFTTADLLPFPGCGPVARAKNRHPSWVRPADRRATGGAVLVEARLVLPPSCPSCSPRSFRCAGAR
jgi:hypothetical protein